MKNSITLPVSKFINNDSEPAIFDLFEWDKTNIEYIDLILNCQNYNKVLIFYEGEGNHEIDFIKYPIYNQSIHFVTARQVHLLSSISNASGCCILFSNEFLSFNNAKINFLRDLYFFQNGQLKPILILSDEEFKIFHTLLELLKKVFFEKHKFYRDILQLYMQAFILNAKQFYDGFKIGVNKDDCTIVVNNFLNLVEKHYKEHYTLNQYASLLHITSKQLSSFCKKYLGKNAYTLIEEKIVLEAKRLLFRTNKSIKEISFELNFEDPAYFTRFFKKETGFAPHDFRKNVQ